MSDEYRYEYQNNETNGNQNSGYQNTGYQNGGAYGSYQEPPRKKKGGVGKVVLITLCMMLVGGVAALGGYSVRTIIDAVKGDKNGIVQDDQREEPDTQTNTPQESIPQADMVISQAQTGTVVLTDVSDVVKKIMPAVVSITNTSVYTQYGYNFGFGFWGGGNSNPTQIPTESSGSGIIIGQNEKELLIVTNNHVIEDNESLTVQFADGSSATAVVKGADASNDLAIISVLFSALSTETKNAIAIATLGDSDALSMGQGVIAIGNALGYGQSVSVGCVSALNRHITTDEGTTLTVLQTDAAINPGNSGGALLNVYGEVIGINTAKASDDLVEGIGYAIPITSVKELIDDMMQWETREKVPAEEAGFLGIQNPLTVDSQSAANYGMPYGVYVYAVVEDTPADKAGIQPKDIITRLDRYTITDKNDLNEALEYFAGGDTVTVVIQRLVDGSYKEMELKVTLAYKRDFNN